MESHGGGFEILWKLEIWRAGWVSNADQRHHEPRADGGAAFSRVLLGPEGQRAWWHLPGGRGIPLLARAMLQQGSSRILQFHLQMKQDWPHLTSERWGLSLLRSSWLPLWALQGRTPRQWSNHPPEPPGSLLECTDNQLQISWDLVTGWMSVSGCAALSSFHMLSSKIPL